jgi:hypothetical protein
LKLETSVLAGVIAGRSHAKEFEVSQLIQTALSERSDFLAAKSATDCVHIPQ